MKNKTLTAVLLLTMVIAITSCATSRKYGCPSVAVTTPVSTVNS